MAGYGNPEPSFLGQGEASKDQLNKSSGRPQFQESSVRFSAARSMRRQIVPSDSDGVSSESPMKRAGNTQNSKETSENLDSYREYLREMGIIIQKYPLLSAEEEVDLGRRIQRGKLELQKAAVERDKELIQDAEEAKSTLICSNLSGVVSIAQEKLPGVPNGNLYELMDLIQEGNIELIRSAELFDPAREVRFSTFAFKNIKLHLNKEIVRKGGRIHISANKADKLSQIIGMDLTAEEVAERFGIKASEAQELLSICHIKVESIDTPAGEDTMQGDVYRDWGDFLGVEESGYNKVEQQIFTDELLTLIKQGRYGLTNREIEAIETNIRLHTEYGEEPTFEEVGNILGVKRERPRQLLRRAEKRLRSVVSPEAQDALREFFDNL